MDELENIDYHLESMKLRKQVLDLLEEREQFQRTIHRLTKELYDIKYDAARTDKRGL